MATFILVHGTFAKSAHWPALQDGLTETARAAGDEPLFKQLPWTGRNRAGARQAAASAIFTLVQGIQRTSANEKIFIIGHSHGGSAIAYFLKEHPEAGKTLAGCAFLSTPFVAIRPRKEALRLMSTLLFFPYITFVSLWREIASPEHGVSIEEIASKSFMELAPAYLYQSFGFGVATAVCFLAMFFFRSVSAPQKVEQSIRQQTADIPAGNYLFLRCSGDEAAAALSAAQFIAWLGVKVSTILELLTRLLNPGRVSWGMFLSLLVMSLLYSLIAHGLLFVLPGIAKFGFGYFLSPDGLFLGKLGFVRMIVHMTYIVFTLISFVVVFLLLLCLLVALLIFFAQALTSWAFGWTGLSTGFVVELAIEPLPFGTHSLVHIDWADSPIGLDGIVHSWTYAHPAAIMQLQNWVRASLEKLPTTAPEPTTIRP